MAKAPFIQRTTVMSGTVIVTDTQDDVIVIHDATTLTVALQIQFPSSPIDGQRVTISSVNGITTLGILSPVGAIINTVATLLAGSTGTYVYLKEQNKWYKIR